MKYKKLIATSLVPIAILLVLAATSCTHEHQDWEQQSQPIKQQQEQSEQPVQQQEQQSSITPRTITDCMYLIVNKYDVKFDEDTLRGLLAEDLVNEYLEIYKPQAIHEGDEPQEFIEYEPTVPDLSNLQQVDEYTYTIDYFETDVWAYRYELTFNDEGLLQDYSFKNITLQ